MTIQAIPLPNLGSYAGGERLMETQGFTLDGQALMVRLSYTDTQSALRHAAWLYDLKLGSYTLNINTTLSKALGQVSSDLTMVEVHALHACAVNGQQGLAVLYSVPESNDNKRLALIAGGNVMSLDLLGEIPAGSIRKFAISADSRFVALQTDVAIIDPLRVTDANQADDVYLLDRQTGEFTRVSSAAGDDPSAPSALGSLRVINGQVQITFISDHAFSNKDTNGSSGDAGDAYLWSQGLGGSGLAGNPLLTLLSSNGSFAIGGMTTAADGQPEFAGPMITPAGIYFNSNSPQLSSNDSNNSPDIFVHTANQTQRVVWSPQTTLDAGAHVVSTSQGGEIVALLTASTAFAGSYGSSVLMVLDTRDVKSALLPANFSAADGAVLSAALSPNGAMAAFTSNSVAPLVGNATLIDGTLYVAATGWIVDREATGSVAISGSVAEGQTIGASVASLADEDGAIRSTSYQWQRSGDGQSWTDIQGAADQIYTLPSDQSEVGKYLRLRLITTDELGGTSELFSVPQQAANVDDEAIANLAISGKAKQGNVLTLTLSAVSDADGVPAAAYQWQWLNATQWQDITSATAASFMVPSESAWIGRSVRAKVITTDPMGGTTEFFSETQTIEASTRLTLSATHWKSGKGALANVDIGIMHDGLRLKTGSDGRISAQGFSDPDSVNDGYAVLRPQLEPAGVQSAIGLADVLGALKVYLNKPLDTANNTPYKFIAADFQGDGDVDLSDVLSLLKYYLKKPVDTAPSWVFVDSAQTVLVGGQSFPESKTAGQVLSKSYALPADIEVDLNSDMPLQLIGVLRGDLDGSWIPNLK